MKTKIIKSNSLISLFTTAILCICMVSVSIITINASDGWIVELEDSMWTSIGTAVFVTKDDEFAKVDSIESSNTSVIKIRTEQWTDESGVIHDDYVLDPIKAGKSEITVNYTRPDGISETFKKTVNVKKHPKEIKSLKINGKKIDVNKNKLGVYVKCKKTKVSIKAAIKKGWKINGISAYLYKDNYQKYKKTKVTSKMLIKGTKIKFPNNYEVLSIFINLNKGSSFINYSIDLYR